MPRNPPKTQKSNAYNDERKDFREWNAFRRNYRSRGKQSHDHWQKCNFPHLEGIQEGLSTNSRKNQFYRGLSDYADLNTRSGSIAI